MTFSLGTKFSIFSIIILMCLFSCRGDSDAGNYVFFGSLKNSNTQESIANADIVAYTKGAQSGGFSDTFVEIERVISDAQGNFELSFERDLYSEIKIDFYHSEYFIQELFINPDDTDLINGNDVSTDLTYKSAIQVNLQNTNPLAEDDVIEFKFSNMHELPIQCVCCTNSSQYFTGVDIDTTLQCALPAGFELEYIYFVTKQGNTQFFNGSEVASATSTTTININY